MPEDLLERYRDRARKLSPGGELWFSPQVASEIIKELKHYEIRVLGIDTAATDGKTTVPVDILDLSIIDCTKDESINEALEFLDNEVPRDHIVSLSIIE